MTVPGMIYHARGCAPLADYGLTDQSFTKEAIEELKRDLKEAYDNGLTLKEASDALGISYHRAQKWSKRLELHFKDQRTLNNEEKKDAPKEESK